MYFPSASFCLQPPPKFTDKQLEEREHTVDEWKGETTRLKKHSVPWLHLHSPCPRSGLSAVIPAPQWGSASQQIRG